MIEFLDEFSRRRKGDLVVLGDSLPPEDEIGGPPVDGTWDDLPAHLHEPWSGIILSHHADLPEARVRDLLHARLDGMPMIELADFYERYWARVPVTHLRGEWFMLSRGFDLLHSPMQANIKRVTDIALAGGMLLLAAPFMLLVALVVRLDSHGPILFRQARTGMRGVAFHCLKFRSMAVGSEQGDKYTQKNDKRITRIGGFLRRSRLDELPQLFNILAGDMSFIGPRAEWDMLVARYENQLPYYHLRHLVRPGLTGWAQINYSYGANIEDTRMKLEYDLYYIKYHSLSLDLAIVLGTIRVVLSGVGAR